MQLEAFDFSVPESLIAQQPCEPREAARLLCVDQEGFHDYRLLDLPGLMHPSDLLLVNTTQVLPARLYGWRDGVAVEITLLNPVGKSADESLWSALGRPGKRLRVGDRLAFAEAFTAEVRAKNDAELTLAFEPQGTAFTALLERYGTMPLPPYIKRPRGGDQRDRAAYQSIFARDRGAVAAPTASLHITPTLLQALDARGIRRAEVTLHVGLGTFAPVTVADSRDHVMHQEWCRLPPSTAAAIAETKAQGGRVIALGTTALRTVETYGGKAGEGETRLFLQPGDSFRVVDGLITNFHLPRSTLFMLVAALMGLDRMQAAYEHAIEQRYRFFSYGDASLLLP